MVKALNFIIIINTAIIIINVEITWRHCTASNVCICAWDVQSFSFSKSCSQDVVHLVLSCGTTT